MCAKESIYGVASLSVCADGQQVSNVRDSLWFVQIQRHAGPSKWSCHGVTYGRHCVGNPLKNWPAIDPWSESTAIPDSQSAVKYNKINVSS